MGAPAAVWGGGLRGAASDPAPRPAGGGDVPTRRGLALMPLAAAANAHVFDIAEPTDEQVEAFWADVETARRRIRAEQGFWQKVRGDVSVRTFRDHLPSGTGLGPVLARTSRRDGKAQPGRRGRPTKAGIGTTAPSQTRATRSSTRAGNRRKGKQR